MFFKAFDRQKSLEIDPKFSASDTTEFCMETKEAELIMILMDTHVSSHEIRHNPRY